MRYLLFKYLLLTYIAYLSRVSALTSHRICVQSLRVEICLLRSLVLWAKCWGISIKRTTTVGMYKHIVIRWRDDLERILCLCHESLKYWFLNYYQSSTKVYKSGKTSYVPTWAFILHIDCYSLNEPPYVEVFDYIQ